MIYHDFGVFDVFGRLEELPAPAPETNDTESNRFSCQ